MAGFSTADAQSPMQPAVVQACRDAGFEFRHGKGVNILFDEIGQRVVAAERQLIIDIHAAYFTQQQLLSI